MGFVWGIRAGETDLIGSGEHIKKSRLNEEWKVEWRNEIGGETISTVHMKKDKDHGQGSGTSEV